jgi:hypothetical protein
VSTGKQIKHSERKILHNPGVDVMISIFLVQELAFSWITINFTIFCINWKEVYEQNFTIFDHFTITLQFNHFLHKLERSLCKNFGQFFRQH